MQMNKLTLDQIKVGDYVDCGFIGIVGAIVKSLDGQTYIQVISPKAAAYGQANNCDWLPFIESMFERRTQEDFKQAINLMGDLIARRNQSLHKNLAQVLECQTN